MRKAFLAAVLISILIWRGIVVIPQGHAGLRVSVWGRVSPGTLYPGVYWAWPWLEQVERFETRDRLVASASRIRTPQGANVRLGFTMRYRVNPERALYANGVRPADYEERYLRPLVASHLQSHALGYGEQGYSEAVRESLAKDLEGDGIEARAVLIDEIDSE